MEIMKTDIEKKPASKYSGMKWCLVHIGNDITYGLAFVAGELLRMNHKIMWVDDEIDLLKQTIGIIKKDNRNKMLLTHYQFFSIILEEDLSE